MKFAHWHLVLKPFYSKQQISIECLLCVECLGGGHIEIQENLVQFCLSASEYCFLMELKSLSIFSSFVAEDGNYRDSGKSGFSEVLATSLV